MGALIAAAQFQFHESSQDLEGDTPYSNVEVIKTREGRVHDLRAAHARVGPRHVVDAATKWLDWPQYLTGLVVGELRREAEGLKPSGRPCAPAKKAICLQAYLIAAILACVLDSSPVRGAVGFWFIRHGHANYKTGGMYSERPPLVMDPGIYNELEALHHHHPHQEFT
ncbi:hypothetical protein HXX76_003922 [Chlamydomonas incerta]|uniref:Uncharacterized protein n=1 Tax=Chlamydomonas incerta TaxID=51695 RepID=A0A835T937_CHLIN|nr:hypothetical protein HXX76_003922 [Chlamydomonas incerta]|eukprot:KAG2441069.1 hypothetical protein HXX76_003922 [Chlamydomonas incerta]